MSARQMPRGYVIVGGICLALLLYVLSSGPARTIWPERNFRGGSMQFRIAFGVSPPARQPWAEPVAAIYRPLTWLQERTFLDRPLTFYWRMFNRENFYNDEEAIDGWPAVKYSRIGMSIQRWFDRRR